MLKYVKWTDLSEAQKRHAVEQFVELEAYQNECDVEKMARFLAGNAVSMATIGENNKLRELTSVRNFEIDTEDEDYIYVD